VKRAFDIALCVALAVPACLPMLLIALAIRLTSRGPVLYWSDRVGRHNRLFSMPKFRTMRTGAPEVATHLLLRSEDWITPVGRLLRATSFDELPQLWSILRGDMSFVGPRPALHNQHDLVALRTGCGVDRLTPGLTGWAQINGRDTIGLEEKTRLDAEYLARQSLGFDLQILGLTAVKVLRREGVAQAGDASLPPDAPSTRRAA
jgi:O-antigen biosynthesis protein WbqP